MGKCIECENWINATAECSIQLKDIANGWETSESIIIALDKDSTDENNCEEYA